MTTPPVGGTNPDQPDAHPQAPQGASTPPAHQQPMGHDTPSGQGVGAQLAALPKPALIAIGVGLLAVLAGGGLLLGRGGSNHASTGTQQLQANVPSTPQAALPDGVSKPAPDATGRIIDTESLAIDREQAEVTKVTLAPFTYVKVGEWWSRADDNGVVYLPPAKALADAMFFSADDQSAPYAGETTEATATVTSVTFEKGTPGGYNLDPGAQVWYQNETFQTDPAYILIPKGTPGNFQIFVGSAPIDLAIP